MTKKITTRDMEAISAYLDNELKPREYDRLTARLQAEPRLRAVLDEMKQTRTMLRNIPQVRPPRNFTLSPEVVPRRSSLLQLFPSLQFASALAAILLVLFVAGDAFGVLAPRPIFTTAQSVGAPEALQLDDTEAMVEGALPGETAVEKSAGDSEVAGDAAVVGESVAVEEAQSEAEPGVEERAMEAGETDLMPAAPLGTQTGQELELSPPSFSLQASEISPTQAVEEPAPQLEATPAQQVQVQDQTEEILKPIAVPGLRFIQIFLAAVVLIAGASAFALRRRMLG
jgi:hypothetical protein